MANALAKETSPYLRQHADNPVDWLPWSQQTLDFSLQQMARGGIQDHLGGGFFRYSVDERWMIPHFEKMLYDNGQLLELFAWAYRLTGNDLFDAAMAGIARWMKREMTSSTGTFYAALDADSEAVEGKYYLWTPSAAGRVVDAKIYPLFARCFGLDKAANFEGQWHLHSCQHEQQLCAQFELDQSSCRAQLLQASEQLLAQRETRISPGLDDKILTSWNALSIRGLACAARITLNSDYFDMAKRCLRALSNECWQDERLLAQSQLCGKRLPAYLDDYAHLLQAILDCLQYQWDSDDLGFAIRLAEQLLDHFADPLHGGFYFTASDHEKLIQRPKSWQDEAMPSGNATAALALNRLGLLTGSTKFTDAAHRALQSVADNINQTPLHAASFVALLKTLEQPPLQIIVRGDASAMQSWHEQLLPRLKPFQSAYFVANDAPDLPAEIASKATDGRLCAWVCEGFSCRAPIFEIEPLLKLLPFQGNTERPLVDE